MNRPTFFLGVLFLTSALYLGWANPDHHAVLCLMVGALFLTQPHPQNL